MTLVRKNICRVERSPEVSGTDVALIGQTNTPRKRGTWLNLAQRNKKALSIVL